MKMIRTFVGTNFANSISYWEQSVKHDKCTICCRSANQRIEIVRLFCIGVLSSCSVYDNEGVHIWKQIFLYPQSHDEGIFMRFSSKSFVFRFFFPFLQNFRWIDIWFKFRFQRNCMRFFWPVRYWLWTRLVNFKQSILFHMKSTNSGFK